MIIPTIVETKGTAFIRFGVPLHRCKNGLIRCTDPKYAGSNLIDNAAAWHDSWTGQPVKMESKVKKGIYASLRSHIS